MSNKEKIFWGFFCLLIIPIGFLILRIHQITQQQLAKETDKLKNVEEFKQELIADKERKIAEAKAQEERITALMIKNDAATKEIKELQAKNFDTYLKQIDTKFDNLSTSIREFSSLFSKGTKNTGNLAESLLNRLFLNIQTAMNMHSKYYTIKIQEPIPENNKIPDMTIISTDEMYPPVYIDCKYPKTSMQNYLKTNDDKHRKEFITSLKKHVDDIFTKYVAETKATFAILFLPSDVAYTTSINLIKGFGKSKSTTITDRSFIDYCFENKVIPTSPTNIVGILTTLEKFFNLFDQIKHNSEQIMAINQWMRETDRFYKNVVIIVKRYNALGSIIDDLRNDLNKIAKKYQKLRLEAINNKTSTLIEEQNNNKLNN